MTEAEWVAGDERATYSLIHDLSPRRQRLLAVAACRSLGRWIDVPAAHAALDVAEKFADTQKSKAALRRAREALQEVRNELRAPPGDRAILADSAVDVALFAVHLAATENAVFGAISHALRALRTAEGIAEAAARLRLFPVIREVVGPSAVRPSLWPEWRTPTA